MLALKLSHPTTSMECSSCLLQLGQGPKTTIHIKYNQPAHTNIHMHTRRKHTHTILLHSDIYTELIAVFSQFLLHSLLKVSTICHSCVTICKDHTRAHHVCMYATCKHKYTHTHTHYLGLTQHQRYIVIKKLILAPPFNLLGPPTL